MRNLCAIIIILAAFMVEMPATLLAGSLEGRVLYKGKPRPPKQLKMAEDGSCRAGLSTDIFDEKFVHLAVEISQKQLLLDDLSMHSCARRVVEVHLACVVQC